MNASATASDSPLIQGRNAREYGKLRESCPHAEGTQEREAWLAAFDGDQTVDTAADAVDDPPRG